MAGRLSIVVTTICKQDHQEHAAIGLGARRGCYVECGTSVTAMGESDDGLTRVT